MAHKPFPSGRATHGLVDGCLRLRKAHKISWEDNYAWIHQENILEVLKDPTKLNSEVRKFLEKNNEHTEHHLKNTMEFQKTKEKTNEKTKEKTKEKLEFRRKRARHRFPKRPKKK